MLLRTKHFVSIFASNALLINLLIVISHCLDPLQEARCLSCIKNVTNLLGIDTTKRCEGYYCGQYQLSYSYWAESGKPGSSQGARDYEKCARDKSCAEQAVRGYFKKFKRDCNNDGTIDCLDMAALHKAGPMSCSSDWFYKSRYWLAFNKTTCATNRDQPSEDIRLELEEQNRPAVREMMKNESLTQDCLDCICDAVSGCNTSVNNCGSGAVCGPFAISQTYWKDGRKPGASWTACARTKECSMVTVKNYMEKNKRDCNGDGLITCEDYAAIHRRGPQACLNRDLFKDHYWNKFQACRANQKPNKDVNMVKVNEDSDDTSPNLASRDDTITTPAQPPTSSPTLPLPTSPSTSSTTTTTTTTTTTISSSTTAGTTTTTSTTSTTPRPDDETESQETFHESPQQPSHSNHAPQAVDSGRNPTYTTLVMDSSHLDDSYTAPATVATTSSGLRMVPTSTPFRRIELVSTAEPAEIEYSVPEFAIAAADQDKTASFDRVATGIFASPDFTKSYPPVPEIVAQERPPVELMAPPGDPLTATHSSKPQQRVNTNHSRGPLAQVSVNKLAPADGPAKGGPAKSSMHNQKAPTDQHQQQMIDRASGQGDQSSGQSIFGSDSMSISHLFDKGLNESSRIASECLECICDASSNCDTTVQCISKQREKNRCGLYMISWNQYQESDISLTSLISAPPGSSDESMDERMYYECTTDRACAEKLIHLYIEKHQKDCNNDGKIDCFDIAAIHRVGPESCNSGKFLSSQYWKDFNICYTTDRLATTTIPPQASHSGSGSSSSSAGGGATGA